ncbi:MAG TPA: PfkB family carbohydrate kinase [Kofleriaceae bacterium]|nr:PfkB family carbohydrate kinase [Kofleriaceae bacterium]
MRAVSWGEVLWDLFPDAERLGGAPANVAYHLAALGRETALVSRVGDDPAGRRAVAALADAGVDVSGVQVDAARPTGAVEVELEGGEARYRLRAGCAWEHIEFDGAAAAAVARAHAICFGTLSQRQAPARRALEAALAARGAGCLAVCDLNLRPGEQDRDLVRWAIGAADLIKLNEREEAQLAALLRTRDVIGVLLGLGMRQVALTRGAAGCTLFSADGHRIDQPGFPAAPGGDTVGCGDAFTAVWIDSVLAGVPLPRAVEAACRYAAHVASQPGATPPIPAALVRTTAPGRS